MSFCWRAWHQGTPCVVTRIPGFLRTEKPRMVNRWVSARTGALTKDCFNKWRLSSVVSATAHIHLRRHPKVYPHGERNR